MPGGGSNAAKFAFINSSGVARSHWGMVYAIQRNREDSARRSAIEFQNSAPFYSPRSPRKVYSAGTNMACLHCNKNLEAHTRVKKFCPK